MTRRDGRRGRAAGARLKRVHCVLNPTKRVQVEKEAFDEVLDLLITIFKEEDVDPILGAEVCLWAAANVAADYKSTPQGFAKRAGSTLIAVTAAKIAVGQITPPMPVPPKGSA